MVGLARRLLSRVAVGVSGGVDSAVAAWILKNKGYDVHGVFMHNWDHQEEEGGSCSATADAETAAWVCKELDIPLLELNFVTRYWNDVFEYLLSEYSSGRTPNPDLMCNRHVKFGGLLTACQARLGEDCRLATGHYARLQPDGAGGVRLLQAVDQSKDQSFFLSQVSQQALQRALFPLGTLHKSRVRQLAASAGLTRVADKKDSTGICFIGKRNFQQFIAQYISDRPGQLLDVDTGQRVAQHQGQHLYTVGQRCRLPIATVTCYYVAHKLGGTCDIVVCGGEHHPSLYSRSLYTREPHWVAGQPPEDLARGGEVECEMRFRHLQPLEKCTVRLGTSATSETEKTSTNDETTSQADMETSFTERASPTDTRTCPNERTLHNDETSLSDIKTSYLNERTSYDKKYSKRRSSVEERTCSDERLFSDERISFNKRTLNNERTLYDERTTHERTFPNERFSDERTFSNERPFPDERTSPGEAMGSHNSSPPPSSVGLTITLERPMKAIAPGQFAVLYQGAVCLGSAAIASVGPSLYATNEGGCRDTIAAIRSELPSLDLTELANITRRNWSTSQSRRQYRQLLGAAKRRYCAATGTPVLKEDGTGASSCSTVQ